MDLTRGEIKVLDAAQLQDEDVALIGAQQTFTQVADDKGSMEAPIATFHQLPGREAQACRLSARRDTTWIGKRLGPGLDLSHSAQELEWRYTHALQPTSPSNRLMRTTCSGARMCCSRGLLALSRWALLPRKKGAATARRHFACSYHDCTLRRQNNHNRNVKYVVANEDEPVVLQLKVCACGRHVGQVWPRTDLPKSIPMPRRPNAWNSRVHRPPLLLGIYMHTLSELGAVDV